MSVRIYSIFCGTQHLVRHVGLSTTSSGQQEGALNPISMRLHGENLRSRMQFSVMEDIYIHAPSKPATGFALLQMLLLLALMGCFTSLAGLTLNAGVARLYQIRLQLVDATEGPHKQFAVWVASASVCAALAAALMRIAPRAAGSGIPEFKAHLDGVAIVEFLSPVTLLVKAAGLVLSLGAGLSIGKEGPFVHMAAIIATLLMQVPPLWGRSRTSVAAQLQALGAAAAVGVVTTFGAPIGGLLFSIEVTSNFYCVHHLTTSFFASTCALAFARKFLKPYVFKAGLSMFHTNLPETEFSMTELGQFAALGLVCALLSRAMIGALLAFASLKVKIQETFPSLLATCLVVGAVAAASAAAVYPLGHLFMESGYSIVTDLFTTKEGVFDHMLWRLAVFLVLKTVLTAAALNMPVPSGCFTPTFVMGAVVGRLLGELLARSPYQLAGLAVIPGNYAVVGAASTTAAATQTVSVAVIALELTGQQHLLLPICCGVMAATLLSRQLGSSIYELMRRLKGIPHYQDVKQTDGTNKDTKLVGDIVYPVSDIPCVTAHTTVTAVKELLEFGKSMHIKSFPIVDNFTDLVLLGTISLQDLQEVSKDVQKHRQEVLKHAEVIDKLREPLLKPSIAQSVRERLKRVVAARSRARVENAMSASLPALSMTEGRPLLQPLDCSSPDHEDVHETARCDAIPSVATSDQTEDEMHMVANRIRIHAVSSNSLLSEESLAAIVLTLPQYWTKVDQAPFVVSSETPVYKAQMLFKLLRLSSALVTSSGGVLIGIVSRTDVMMPDNA